MTPLLAVFALYLLLMIVVGEVSARLQIRSLDEYLLSGRRQGTWGTAATLAATVIGAGSTVGAAGVAYFVGISASWYLLSAVPGLLLLAFTLAPAIRRLSVYSVPEYVTRRYGTGAGTLAAGLGVLALLLFLAAQFYAMGALVARLTGWAVRPALLVAALAVVLYTWRGGNWAIHWSDSLQMVWIYAGLILAAIYGLREVGGAAAFAEPPAAAGQGALGNVWFHPITREAVSGFGLFALGNTVVAWIIMSTTWHFAMQSTAQRLLSSRDPAVARRACLLAAAAIVPLAFLVALIGMSARVLYPDLEATAGMEQVFAFPAFLKGILSPVFAGLVLAAVVAVIMSTCDSALLGAATLWVRDFLPRLGREVSEDLATMRRWVLAAGALATAGALFATGVVPVLELVAAIYGVALFGPLLLGPFWRRASGPAAVVAIAAAAVAGAGWRASGLEARTGIHMLNLGLPISIGALILGSWIRPAGPTGSGEATR